MTKGKRIFSAVLSLLVGFTVFTSAGPVYAADPPARGMQLYVSQSGNDSAAGTLDAPLKTLEGAKNKVREIKKNGLPAGGITINIAGGTYPLTDKSFELTAEDSGEPGKEIVWQALPGEQVVFTGGASTKISDFTPVTDQAIWNRLPESSRNNVLVCDMSKLGLTNIAPIPKVGYGWPELPPPLTVAVDGEQYHIARYPNEGEKFLRHDTIDRVGFIPRDHMADPDGSCPACSKEAGNRILCKYSEEEYLQQPAPIWSLKESKLPGKYEKWVQEPDAWTFGYFCWRWAEDNISLKKLERINRGGVSYLQFTGGEPSRYGAREAGANGVEFYVYNMLCELDVPGEWYLDRETNKFYLYPKKEQTDSTVEFSVMRNAFFKLTDVSHVQLKFMNFTMGNGNALELHDCSNVLVAGCKFTNMGQKGVVVDKGHDNTVQSCDFYRTGAGGVSVTGGDRYTLTPANNKVDNCDFNDYAVIKRTYSPAVFLDGVGLSATNNKISNAPHQAIAFNGNNNLIANNDISNVCYETADSGAIYSVRNWTGRGTRIENNYIHDMVSNSGGGSSAVYLDDMISGTKIINNLIVNMPGRVFLVGGGRDNVINGNILLNPDNGVGIHWDNRGMGWAHAASHVSGGACYAEWDVLTHNDKFDTAVWKENYPEMFAVDFSEAEKCSQCSDKISKWGSRPGGADIQNNIMVGVNNPYGSVCQIAKDEAKAFSNNPVFAAGTDIGFVSAQAKKFEVKPGSKIKEIQGENHFDISRVGLYSDLYRTIKEVTVDAPELLFPEENAKDVEIDSGVNFSWNTVKGAGTYLVEVSESTDFSQIVQSVSTQNTHVRISGLDISTIYYWRVTALEDRLNGTQATSPVRSFTTSSKDPSLLFESFADPDFSSWKHSAGTPSHTDKTAHAGRFSYETDENTDLIERQFPGVQNKVVSIWMYDTLQKDPMTSSIVNVVPTASEWAAIGVNVRQSADVYVTRIGSNWSKTNVKRSEGWHELKWDYQTPGRCTLYIDEISVGTFDAAGFSVIKIGDPWNDSGAGSVSTILYDDLRIGEPTIDPKPTAIELNPDNLTLQVGQEIPLNALLTTDIDADMELVWDSVEYEIARISDGGVVFGLRPGVSTISVHAKGYETPTATCKVTVEGTAGTFPLTVEGGEGSGLYTSGAAVNVTATVPSGQIFTGWTSNGLDLTEEQISSESITFTMPDNPVTLQAHFETSDIPVTGVVLEPDNLTLKAGEQAALTAAVLPQNAGNQKVYFSSSDSNIAAVDKAGIVLALNAGTVTITATTEEGKFTDSCTVTIDARVPSNLIQNPSFETGFEGWGTYPGTEGEGIQVQIDSQTAHEGSCSVKVTTTDSHQMISGKGYAHKGVQYRLEAPDLASSHIPYEISAWVKVDDESVHNMGIALILRNEKGGNLGATIPVPYKALSAADGWVQLNAVLDPALLAGYPSAHKLDIIIGNQNDGTSHGTYYVDDVVLIQNTPVYPLTVDGGSGSGHYEAEQNVAATANAEPDQYFVGWIAEGISLNEEQRSANPVFFTMPENPVVLTAQYEKLYTVTVHDSTAEFTGAGQYKEGSVVQLNAGTKEGFTFSGWNIQPADADVVLADALSSQTSFIMPGENITITACWTEEPPVDPSPAPDKNPDPSTPSNPSVPPNPPVPNEKPNTEKNPNSGIKPSANSQKPVPMEKIEPPASSDSQTNPNTTSVVITEDGDEAILTVNGIKIVFHNLHQVFTPGTVITVNQDPAVTALTENVLKDILPSKDKLTSFCISAMKDNTAVQPSAPMSITLFLPENQSTANLKMFCTSDNNVPEEIMITIDEAARTVTTELAQCTAYILCNAEPVSIDDTSAPSDSTPSSSDNFSVPVVAIVIILALSIALVIIFLRKRKH